ncbi:dehydrogenase [Lysinibacillus sp. 2017]|uniref:gluconate 2-dehydrogenase subunit 3 family protein n=1 Tax=unclassified Lysinibacillus TaxID=2636778 RepID=UPI000D526381|nr:MULTISPECIES: gluconate 2-dehydrogenase subunit 3 family protein [unclassified Lysinibacillus]AWE08209.1 dehydrogenase [Lysinibacillus sp. 2017]TGN36465.1 gluconate 2-dehydrogenase subunit 3 family protein [Lysinibacillus sp. S2017]
MDENKETMLEKKSSRRSFLKNSGLAVGGLVLGGSLGSLFTKKGDTPAAVVTPSTGGGHVDYTEALQFFRRKSDFNAISAAMDVIYPEDSLGPGAVSLGAPYFLDKQLAGPWGTNSDDYRKAPFQPGEIPLNNGQIFIEGARKLNEVAKKEHDVEGFSSLDEEQKIAILTKFEAGEVELILVPAPAFFALLRSATLQGCFSDPLYGGNKNMAGWEMKEFPGAQMSYIQYAETEEFVKIAPISVGGHSH